jgi:hypothetical protein
MRLDDFISRFSFLESNIGEMNSSVNLIPSLTLNHKKTLNTIVFKPPEGR